MTEQQPNIESAIPSLIQRLEHAHHIARDGLNDGESDVSLLSITMHKDGTLETYINPLLAPAPFMAYECISDQFEWSDEIWERCRQNLNEINHYGVMADNNVSYEMHLKSLPSLLRSVIKDHQEKEPPALVAQTIKDLGDSLSNYKIVGSRVTYYLTSGATLTGSTF